MKEQTSIALCIIVDTVS